MVTPNNNPPPPDPLAAFFGPIPKDDPHQEPRDNPKFIADFANGAERFGEQEAAAVQCGCKKCLLKLPFIRLAKFASAETLRAAFTGDTSKLDALVEKVEKLKKAG